MVRWKVHVRGKDFFQLSYSSHHAILDGWSLAAMLSEVIESYPALLNMGSPVAAPAVTYKRFVALEQSAVANEESRRFWLQQLEEFQATTLPRISRSEGVTGEVRIHPVALSSDVSEKLHALAAAEGLPVKCILLAAHLKFLSTVSGQTDVTTGIVMEGRPSEQDGEKILGLFLNTVPMRIKLGGGTWRQLARQVFQRVTEMMPHRRYPLAEIQRQNGGASLFETAFDMVHFHVYEKVLQNRTVSFVEDKFFEATNFPFFAFFQVEPVTREISLRFDYQPSELTRQQVEAFAGYYARILQAIATTPEKRYEAFSPLSQFEHQEWKRFSTGPAMLRSNKNSVVEYIDDSFRNFAGRAGLTSGNKQIHYHELDAASKRIAQVVQENNTRRCVGIVAERSVEALIAAIGVLRAGEAYVPIDPHQPRARMEAMLRQANVSTVLATRVLSHELTNCQVFLIDEILGKSPRQPRISQQPVRPASLAYVLFTSGSTGTPKGVEVTHGNLLHSTEARLEYYQKPVRSFLLASPHWFDSSVAGIFWTLAQGGELVVPDELEIKDPAALSGLIAEHRVSHLLCLPSLYSALLSYPERLTSLETVIVAGEECPPELVSRHRKISAAQLYNEYGPTEATVWCSVHRCDDNIGAKMPIGRPIANTAIYILDDHLAPAPVGTPGEIYVGGDGVARGYAGDSKLISERFIDCPEWIGSRGKLYKTGDLARFLPDGNLEFLGRRDQQVKIRGMRVELSEIENALRKHPAIENCLVLLNGDARREQRLAAYVQCAWTVSTEQLRSFLKESLPNHMIPSAYMFMKTLPCTGNGKIDRRTLPPVEDAGLEQSRPYVAPTTPFEIEIAKIWSEVLQMDQVGTGWEFFEIGGHSLSAMQVAARIRDRFQVEIPLAEYFRNGTVAEQATMVFQRLAFEKPSKNSVGAVACVS
jgi:amino acid adenylation domain-containing protein